MTEEEETKILHTMKDRIQSENFHADLQATEYETNEKNLQVVQRYLVLFFSSQFTIAVENIEKPLI